jgi:phosphotransferase system  glucose/maltose/N-acetylglucosamine-specific IIC component
MTETRTNTRGSGNAPLRSLAYALLVAVLVAFGLHAVFIAGPVMRAAAHEQVVRAVADEDRQFCERFGMRSGTDAFVACSGELSIVRQRQVDRDNAAAQGIL